MCPICLSVSIQESEPVKSPAVSAAASRADPIHVESLVDSPEDAGQHRRRHAGSGEESSKKKKRTSHVTHPIDIDEQEEDEDLAALPSPSSRALPSAAASAAGVAVSSEFENKIIKRFCERLLARSHEWEEHERAQLAVLMQEELNLSEKRFIKLLLRADATGPSVLASLGDAGIHFSADTMLYIIAKNLRREPSGAKMILRIEEAFEQGLLSVTNEEHMKLVSVLCI